MNIIKQNLFDKILIYIIFCFPLIITLRSATINIVTILIFIVIILFFLTKKINITLNKNKFLIYLIIFFAFFFINTIIHNQNFDLILKTLGNYRYLMLAITVSLFLSNISDRLKTNFYYFNFFFIIFIGLDILYQYFFQKDIFGFAAGMCDNYGKNCQRYSGVFGSELIGGSYLAQIGLLFFFLLLDQKKHQKYFVIIKEFLFLLFLFVIILLTGERNALIIFVLTIFFYFFFQKKLLNLISLFFIFFLIAFILSQKVNYVSTRFFKPTQSLSILSFQNKKTTTIEKIKNSPWSWHFQAAAELFLERPLIGHGTKSFRVLCEYTDINKKLIKVNITYTACSTHPHNYLLEFLAEHGLVGALFYIGLIFFVILELSSIKNYSKKDHKVLLGLGCLLLAIMFPLKPSGSFFSTFNASIFFYIIGFFLYYLKKRVR